MMPIEDQLMECPVLPARFRPATIRRFLTIFRVSGYPTKWSFESSNGSPLGTLLFQPGQCPGTTFSETLVGNRARVQYAVA
jgi:hypothetical protein